MLLATFLTSCSLLVAAPSPAPQKVPAKPNPDQKYIDAAVKDYSSERLHRFINFTFVEPMLKEEPTWRKELNKLTADIEKAKTRPDAPDTLKELNAAVATVQKKLDLLKFWQDYSAAFKVWADLNNKAEADKSGENPSYDTLREQRSTAAAALDAVAKRYTQITGGGMPDLYGMYLAFEVKRLKSGGR